MTRQLRDNGKVGTEVGSLVRTIDVLAARHSDAADHLVRSLRALKILLDQNMPAAGDEPSTRPDHNAPPE